MRSSSSLHADSAVAVVDPYSSGALLAAEIKRRGHESICVQSTVDIPKMYESSFRPHDFDARIGHEGDIEKTAAQLSGLGTRCVLAGCELGVELADQLSQRLGLKSNGTRCSAARRNKWRMAEAVRAQGLRTPAQFFASDVQQLRQKLGSQGRWPVVVKPLRSSGSDGVCLCGSIAEVEAAFADIVSRKDVFRLTNPGVLVQEFLSGPEYAIDTVSCRGRHRVAAYWRYGKPSGDVPVLGTDSFELLRWNRQLHAQLFPFVAGALDSLEIRE
ncbi:MAG: ATP-grasp domain-containing protein, partial [Planctomycetota bacterium]|nr:ATP-grasp domain-containing protein [Planctomycetota bacterium]